METAFIEYKRELTDGLEKEVVAFLNSGGGKIYIGYDNDGHVIGIDDADKLSLSIIDRIKNNIMPSVMGIFNLDIEQADQKNYIVITVAMGLEKPYFLKKYGMSPNGCYYRIGTQSAQMSFKMINNLLTRRINNTMHNIVAPNQKLTFSQLCFFYHEKGYDVNNEYFLHNLELYTDDGKFNYAAYLMSDNNGTSIKVARFNGTEKLDIAERNEFGRCCLIKSAIYVLEKMVVANPTVVRVGGMARRKEIKLVDPDALREVILNALIHNDYINGSFPIFEIYDDRIEVISSGGLPIGLSEDDFFKGRSMPRNRELVRIFSDMDLCEQLGSGMKKILKAYTKDIFTISEYFIAVKLKYDQNALQILKERSPGGDLDAGDGGLGAGDGGLGAGDGGLGADDGGLGAGDGVFGEIENLTGKILIEVTNDPYITQRDLADTLNISIRSIQRGLHILRDKGIIERRGGKRYGYWYVKI